MTMNRRSFLQAFAICAGTAIVHEALPIKGQLVRAGTPYEGSIGDWEFDAAAGIYKNPRLTEHVQRKAAVRAGKLLLPWPSAGPIPKTTATTWQEPSGLWRCERKGVQEFGRAFQVYSLSDDWYVERMIDQMAQARRTRLRWYLVPEVRAAVPTDFGRNRAVCWYGIAKA